MSELQRKLWNAGFTRESTGGGCYAYYKALEGKRYLFLTDADGTQLAYILRDGSRSLVEVENYAGNPTIDPSRDYPTIESALAAFGVQI
jgi:hypothetical protein